VFDVSVRKLFIYIYIYITRYAALPERRDIYETARAQKTSRESRLLTKTKSYYRFPERNKTVRFATFWTPARTTIYAAVLPRVPENSVAMSPARVWRRHVTGETASAVPGCYTMSRRASLSPVVPDGTHRLLDLSHPSYRSTAFLRLTSLVACYDWPSGRATIPDPIPQGHVVSIRTFILTQTMLPSTSNN